MRFLGLKKILPSWKNVLLAILSAVLLILAFPDFEFWFLAWFALVPLMWAVEKQKHCVTACFNLGWIFGTIFFFGTCWWLTFAPITYAGFPPLLAYFLLFCVTVVAGMFPAIFTAILAVLFRRFGSWAFLAAPFVWVTSEFARYWITGNNWNAIGYSQAFTIGVPLLAATGGVLLISFMCSLFSSGLALLISRRRISSVSAVMAIVAFIAGSMFLALLFWKSSIRGSGGEYIMAQAVAVQPNVPMSGLNAQKWGELRERQVELAELGLKELASGNRWETTVILPESPMNFMYNDDREFQQFIGDFARRNRVRVLFNSAEPDASNGKYFNSAVLIGPDGREAAQYDKIYLLPFGEAVPLPLQNIIPAFVGTFSYGSEHDLIPLSDVVSSDGGTILHAEAGIMICFESHFGELSREYVRNGVDVIIEMTNDGYLGPTPVLRQHLANAVFRAVETNRPLLRVTNVGITAYIDERGQVSDPLPSYTEGTRVWTVSKSDRSQTFYVKYGDWFAWLSVAITLGLIVFSFRKRREDLPEVS